jgi:hypothetical protein
MIQQIAHTLLGDQSGIATIGAGLAGASGVAGAYLQSPAGAVMAYKFINKLTAETNWADLAARTTVGAGAGLAVGSQMGDTPEERGQNALTMMLALAAGGTVASPMVRRAAGKILKNKKGAIGSLESEAAVQRQQTGLTAAIKSPATGKVYSGYGHKQIFNQQISKSEPGIQNQIWNEIFKDNTGKYSPYIGFVDKQGNFVSREEAEQIEQKPKSLLEMFHLNESGQLQAFHGSPYRFSKDIEGNELADIKGNPVQLNEDGTITLYHRTTPEKAAEIKKTGIFKSLENANETFFSNKKDGQGIGYGDVVVTLKVNPKDVRLDDAFDNGEIHVSVSNKKLSKNNFVSKMTGGEGGAIGGRELPSITEGLRQYKKNVASRYVDPVDATKQNIKELLEIKEYWTPKQKLMYDVYKKYLEQSGSLGKAPLDALALTGATAAGGLAAGTAIEHKLDKNKKKKPFSILNEVK